MDEKYSTQREFKNALSQFATGVAVVCVCDEDGAPHGVTINSFNSVSLEPKLVLWSLSKKSRLLDLFCRSNNYVINLLSNTQQDEAMKFAQSVGNRFDGIAYSRSASGAPLLKGASVWFECTDWARYDGGDHVIFVAEIHSFEVSPSSPLVFLQGQFLCRDHLVEVAATARSIAPERQPISVAA